MENSAQNVLNGDILTLALVGLLIVFSVLTVIVCAVAVVRKLDDFFAARAEARAAARAEAGGAEAQPGSDANIDAVTSVLIAAAAATVLQGRHRIRSVRRLLPPGSPRSPWSSQGRLYLQGSHSIQRKKSH